jgi:hypothetical protein
MFLSLLSLSRILPAVMLSSGISNLHTYNKSLDASGTSGLAIDNLSVTWLRAAASIQSLGCYFLTMKRLFALTFSLLLVVVSFPVSAINTHGVSQKVRRGISGRITDPNGAVVPGAKITIVGRSSHTTVIRTSNAKGQYAADLDPDTYDVTAGAPGFKTVTRKTGVVRGSRSYMDFVLYPGDTGSPIVNPSTRTQPNKSLDASGGSVFLNLIGPAMIA